jgi:hypothetical protein
LGPLGLPRVNLADLLPLVGTQSILLRLAAEPYVGRSPEGFI